MVTRSGSESAFILRMTWPLCALTVISTDAELAADLLFNSPETTSAITSRSRGVSDAWHSRRTRSSELLTECDAAALDSTANGVQQHIVLERLRQEFDGSRLHRPHAHRHVAVSGDEDDRHVGPLCELLLQLETAQPGQRHIEHQAGRNRGSRTGEELLCGCERFGSPACEF